MYKQLPMVMFTQLMQFMMDGPAAKMLSVFLNLQMAVLHGLLQEFTLQLTLVLGVI